MLQFDKIEVFIENHWLSTEAPVFRHQDVVVQTSELGEVSVTAQDTALSWIRLSVPNTFFSEALILGDAWERGYGDLSWKKQAETGKLPWYFIARAEDGCQGFGVKTRPNAMCFWQCGSDRISLWIDVRNGSRPLQLHGRTLQACSVVYRRMVGDDVFSFIQEFCGLMCEHPRLPKTPVFGGNDWYCNYGNNSFEKILTHTKRIAQCAAGLPVKPYMVIDDGWELCLQHGFNGGPWLPNGKFRDMAQMAQEIEASGAIPGIWFRPLWTVEQVPLSCVLKTNGIAVTLDPSSPITLDMVKQDVSRIRSWGYKLIKHDFTTYDILGQWGFQMGEDICCGDVVFHDTSKTTAEIINGLYDAIREAAGDDVMIMGCNTISHLSAGVFELYRTGDDTSGKEWERTRKMGINTLAFRMPQHNRFYCADADCVGITQQVDFSLNRQWLDVLAKSGTALFVSIAEDSFSEEVRRCVTEAFQKAASNLVPSRPVDWFETVTPTKWDSAFGSDTYNWNP